MLIKELDPPVKCDMRDAKAFAQFFDRFESGKIFCQSPKDKKHAISSMWDEHVRQDGMSMTTTRADHPSYGKKRITDRTVNEIGHATLIVAMRMAVSLGFAYGTDLHARLEIFHEV